MFERAISKQSSSGYDFNTPLNNSFDLFQPESQSSMFDICLDSSGSDLDRNQFRKFLDLKLLSKSEFLTNNFYPLLMADFKTVKTFTLLAKIGSGLSLSALFPAAKSSKAASFFKMGLSDLF